MLRPHTRLHQECIRRINGLTFFQSFEIYAQETSKEHKGLDIWRILQDSPRFKAEEGSKAKDDGVPEEGEKEKRPQGNKAAKLELETARLQKEHVGNVASIAQSTKRKADDLRDYVILQVFKTKLSEVDDEDSRVGMKLLKMKKRKELEESNK